MKSLLYANNQNAQTVVAAGTAVNFGNVVRKYGCDINMSGGNPVIGPGYYSTDVNITFLAGATGTETFQIYKNGVAVPGAEATITTADETTYSVTIPCIIRNCCPCGATITVVASGVAGTVTNASAKVERE